ncbi:MAG: hypothetical protein KAJ19_20920, partial [Gammaproteobacteria bacterium]|nr:hypothetical protein [Gammaproteobacteria bacterium]
NDYAEVSIEGIGVVGRLSRPSAENTVSIDAEVDIDHGHSHNISGEHTHTFTDPSLLVDNPLHGHGFTGSISANYTPTTPIPVQFLMSRQLTGAWSPYTEAGYIVLTLTGLPSSWSSASIQLNVTAFRPGSQIDVSAWSSFLGANGVFTEEYGNDKLGGEWTILDGQNTTVSLGTYNRSTIYIKIRVFGIGTINPDYNTVNSFTLSVVENSAVTPAGAGVSVTTSASGLNQVATDKAPDDVQDLSTGNVQITDIASDIASQTIVNLFDITSDVDFDWSWFTDRDVTVEYIGTADDKKIYIRHIFFDVEYRKKEIIFSDEITCEPIGLIDDASGTITGTPNKLITRPDEVRKYILINAGGLSAGYIDSNSFDAAGNSYTGLSYAFDGVLDGGLTVRDVEKKLAFQCRSRWFWNEGKAKIMLRNKVANMSAVKFLAQDDLQLRSIKAKRQRVTDISNVIDLQYNKDWTDTDQKPFIKIASGSDIDSIALNGNYEHRDKWAFDCVANDAMAADLLDYYLDTQATPSTFYT